MSREQRAWSLVLRLGDGSAEFPYEATHAMPDLDRFAYGLDGGGMCFLPDGTKSEIGLTRDTVADIVAVPIEAGLFAVAEFLVDQDSWDLMVATTVGAGIRTPGALCHSTTSLADLLTNLTARRQECYDRLAVAKPTMAAEIDPDTWAPMGVYNALGQLSTSDIFAADVKRWAQAWIVGDVAPFMPAFLMSGRWLNWGNWPTYVARIKAAADTDANRAALLAWEVFVHTSVLDAS